VDCSGAAVAETSSVVVGVAVSVSVSQGVVVAAAVSVAVSVSQEVVVGTAVSVSVSVSQEVLLGAAVSVPVAVLVETSLVAVAVYVMVDVALSVGDDQMMDRLLESSRLTMATEEAARARTMTWNLILIDVFAGFWLSEVMKEEGGKLRAEAADI